MKPIVSIIAVILLIALLVGGYRIMRGSGHWVIDFSAEAQQGVMVIHLDADPARKATLVFTQAREFPISQVILKNPSLSLPRGQIVFFDNTARPGRVTLEIEGHRIDIMDRALLVDGIEHTWSPSPTIRLQN
jgi:hypothetical protein